MRRPARSRSEGSGAAAKSKRDFDKILTINCTAWSSFTAYLTGCSCQADLILLQEHHLPSADVAREAAWARAAGWSASLEAAPATGRGGTSGGVGAVTPCYRGIAVGPGWHSLEDAPGRLSCHIWQGGGIPGGLVVVSVYLECGVGMNDFNWTILRHLAVELRTMQRPFVIGGDFQQSPAELAAAGALEIFGGIEVVAARTSGEGGAGTCCTRGLWSNIDFFIVSRELAPNIGECELVLDAAFRPHRPVSLTIRKGGHLPLERMLAAPRAFPLERPCGPVADVPVDWQFPKDVSNEEALNFAADEWFAKAEKVVATVFHLDGDKRYQGRGGAARFKQMRPQIKQMRGRAKTSPEARAWFWLADRLGELAALAPLPVQRVWEHRGGLLGKIAAWAAPTGQVDVRQLWSARLQEIDGACATVLRQWQSLALGLAEAEAAAWTGRRRRSIREWVAKACANAGGGAHRFTKSPLGWRPDPCAENGRPLGRQERVDQLEKQWRSEVWDPKAAAISREDFAAFEDSALPRPTAPEVRKAALCFPVYTGLGADAWHPRWFAALPDDGLEAWVDMMMIAEAQGWIPRVMSTLTMVFIPKASGGVRPIGLFTASQRLWGKLRRLVAAEWEAAHARPYFWGGTGRSVEDCVWQQCLNGEYAQATSRKAASVLIDLVKAYEMLGHRMCAARFLQAQVPMRYARWCLLCYGSPRVMRLDGVYSAPFRVGASIVAGCAGATTLLRAILLRTCDLAAAAGLNMATMVSLSVVVDDITVQGLSAAEGAPEAFRDFENDVARVVQVLTDGLEGEVGGTISDDKTVIIGTSEEVVQAISSATGGRWSSAAAVRNLGVDVSYSTPAAATQRSRQAAAALRVGRFAFLRRHGGRVAAVARGGPRASMVFGAAVQGATDTMVDQIRSTTGACAFGQLGGSSLTLRFLLADVKQLDPIFDLTLRPLKAWATAVWCGAPAQQRRMAVAFDAASRFLATGGSLDSRAPGPTTAVLLSLKRLGWRADDYRTWVSDRDEVLALHLVCPRSVLILGRLAAERWQWRRVAERYADEFNDFDHGGDLQPLRQALGPKSPLKVSQRELLRCAATRRLWPEWRRALAGYQGSGTCKACGDEVGTLRHALFRCPAMAAELHHRNLGGVGSTGARSAAEHHLFSRGVMPDLRHEAPGALRTNIVQWDTSSKTNLLEGHIFIDGSRINGEDVLLARAGWGIAMVRVIGECIASLWGPFPGVIQCIDAAEVFAATMALVHGLGPINLYSDSAFFVDGWHHGVEWCTAPGRAHADIWRHFWQVAVDFGGAAQITVHKVKAHATAAMVDGGVISDVDRYGNEMADEAAKRGASMHPIVQPTLDKIRASRLAASMSAQWIGVGLELAQRAGALPLALTQAQKAERECRVARKRLEVQKDDTWREVASRAHVGEGAHGSHALLEVAPFLFCSRCGCYASQRLLALAEPCQQSTTPSRRYLLNRLLAGCHPRTGDYLGAVLPWDKESSKLRFTASRRGSRVESQGGSRVESQGGADRR